MKNILVSDIMTHDPVIVKPSVNLFECAKKMVRKRVGSLLIVDKKKLVGFISQKDILWALIKKSKDDLSKIRAVDISPKKIATIKPSATIDEAFGKMKKLKFERLPVIHENNLVGMITVRDILNFHPEFYPELKELAEIREEAKKLKRVEKIKEELMNDGLCEECGNHGRLYKCEGMIICESCRNSS